MRDGASEEARYLDRTAPWVERVELDYVKHRIVDDEAGRKALNGRFLAAQRFAQVDAWSERTEGESEAREFHVLAEVD